MRQQILAALQYPSRNLGNSAPGSWGSLNTSYPQATWGTLDTSNNNGVYTTDPCTTPGATLSISASALSSDTSWGGWRTSMRLIDAGLTQLRPADFAGLTNLNVLDIHGNSISSIPDGFFQNTGTDTVNSSRGNAGLVPSCKWFGTNAPNALEIFVGNNGLTHADIPYDAFDSCFDSGASTAAAASKLRVVKLGNQKALGHINLRWFSKLTNLDRLELNGSYISTYYYADGNDGAVSDRSSKRYTDGSKDTEGATEIAGTALTDRDALGADIKAEIDRYWNDAKSTTGGVHADTAEIGKTGKVNQIRIGYNLCDYYDRHPEVSSYIIGKFRDPDGNSATPVPAAYSNLGCGAGQQPYVSAAEATGGFHWDTWRRPFYPYTGRWDEFRRSDIVGLNVTGLKLTGAGMNSLPAGALEGLNVRWFDARWQSNFEVDVKAWYGTSASVLRNLKLVNTKFNSTDITSHDYFDVFTNLQELDLRGTSIGFINTRWFDRISGLSTLFLGDARVARFYHDADGNDPHAADSNGVDFWTKTALQTAINTARTAQSSTAIAITGNGGFGNGRANLSTPKMAVDICARPKVIWGELIRAFKYVDGDEAWRGVMNEGDVRHARNNALTQAQCRAVPGEAVVKSTMATVDPESVAYDANVHSRMIYQSGVNIDLRLNDINPDTTKGGLGADLNAADFSGFQRVRSIYLDRSGITDIPADTFEEAINLETLSLSGNSLDNADFSGTNFLRRFTKLRTLDLRDNLLTEWDSSWLPSLSQGTLRTLHLADNPITDVDVSNLNLTSLNIRNTNITSIDESIFTQTNLVSFWYDTPTLRLVGLHEDGTAEFLNSLPATLADSHPYSYIGNEQRLADDDLNQAAVDFRIAHNARMKAINDADNGNNVVTAMRLVDPCQGTSCLTEAHKNGFIGGLSSFNGLNTLVFEDANLSSSQVATALRAVADQPMRQLAIVGSPSAFGSGLDDSVLNVFNDVNWRTLHQLRIVDSGLTFGQSRQILSNLNTGAYSPSIRRDSEGNLRWTNHYLTYLDFSGNANLFAGATNDQLATWLNGVTAIRPGFGDFTLKLAGTNLDFDQFRLILDSIQHYTAPPHNAIVLRSLDVSFNPNLWNRYNSSTNRWEDVSAGEIKGLIYRLRGLTSINISDTGLSGREFPEVVDALQYGDIANHRNVNRDLTIKSTNARMVSFSTAGNAVGATTHGGLRSAFGNFQRRFDAAAPALRSLDLARTGIDCADLEWIVDSLDTRSGVLASLTTLDLSGNPDIFSNCAGQTSSTCDSESASDPVVELFGKLANVRHLIIDDAGIDFTELQCVVEGLKTADGDPDGEATLIRTISLQGNTMAFTVPASGQTEAAPAPNAQVVAMFSALPNAYKALRNTGLTVSQASAVLVDLQTGQTGEERDETARRFGAQNPAFSFLTPLPSDLKVQSGRSSVRVTFTHDPMYNNARFTVSRYEYRYRVRPSDATMPWGTSDSERWRTASLDLDTTGAKQFEIYGLMPNTVYQVQLRASSLAQPAIDTAYGGTTINLPLIGEIKPAITEVSMRAGDQVRLEVDIYGTANRLDNTITSSQLVFDWGDSPSGGKFAEPADGRRVTYTAPDLPGQYIISVEAQPDGVCVDHHHDNFGITDAHRERCQAKITINVSRAPMVPEAAAEPINPSGNIPTSLTDADGMAYTVFTPVDGGTFAGTGITVSADKGAVPDRQILGVSAAVSEVQAPEPTPGARMTVAGSLYDINGIQNAGDPPVQSYRLDDPLTVCIPMPTEFSANISDIVVVERKSDGSYGILSTKLRQAAGELNVCGSVSTLPATVGVAKLGVVPEPPVVPTPEVETPETGATAPSTSTATFAMGIGIALIAMATATAAVASAMRRRRSATNTPTR